jgi:ubiquinone/menaquinone biosynthesis C-methylase UbiE
LVKSWLIRPQNPLQGESTPPKQKENKGDIADVVDSRYTGLVDSVQNGWFNKEQQELFKGFKIQADDIVLDLGCGAGEATNFAAEIGAHVIFADSEQEKINQLQARVAQTPARESQGIVCECSPIPLPDESVTKVICMEMLEHVPEPREVIDEMVRVGKPGSKYLITVPDAAGEELQKGIAPAAYYQTPNHIQIFQRDQIKQLLEDAGLVIESHEFSGFYWTMWMCMYWALMQNDDQGLDGAAHDQIAPPFDRILDNWSSVWLKLIVTPGGRELKKTMDEVLAKRQIIVAVKPQP